MDVIALVFSQYGLYSLFVVVLRMLIAPFDEPHMQKLSMMGDIAVIGPVAFGRRDEKRGVCVSMLKNEKMPFVLPHARYLYERDIDVMGDNGVIRGVKRISSEGPCDDANFERGSLGRWGWGCFCFCGWMLERGCCCCCCGCLY